MKAAKRIESYQQARQIVDDMLKADDRRSAARAAVERQISGNLPYDPAELKSKGQGYRSNINFRELEGNTRIRIGSFLRLIFDAPSLVSVRIDDPEMMVNFRAHYATIIQEELHRLFTSIPGFFLSFSKAIRNMVVHGPGILFWPTEKDFIPKSAKPGKVLFSQNSDEDPDQYDVVAVIDELPWDAIFGFIADPAKREAAEKLGWKTKRLIEIIDQMTKKESAGSLSRPPETEEEMAILELKRDALSRMEGRPQSVETIHVYSREASGGVTHSIMLHDEELLGNINGDDGYIFYKEEAFESFDDVLVVLLNEVGNDGIHGIRGYGHKIYPHCVVSNRMMNTAIDGAQIRSGLIVQTPVAGTKSVSDVVRLGPVTVLSDDNKVVTGNIGADVEGVISVRALLQSNMANSFGMQRPQAEGSAPGQSYKTARQTDYEMVRANALVNVEVAIFYRFVDRAIESIVRKMKSSKLSPSAAGRVRDFKDRCLRRGVPEEIMNGFHFEVTSGRAIGNGSMEMLLTMTREMLAIAPYLPEDGKREVIRDFVSARVGAENSERYMPLYDTDQITHFSHQLARFENNDMMLGAEALVSPDDDHIYHLTEHIQGAIGQIQAFLAQRSTLNAVEIERFTAMVIGHISAHLPFVQGDLNRQAMQSVAENLQQIKVFHRRAQNLAREQVAGEQQAEQEKMAVLQQAMEALKGTDLQLQMMKMIEEAKLKAAREQNNQKLKTMRTLHAMQLADAQTQAKIENLRKETDAKVSAQGGL